MTTTETQRSTLTAHLIATGWRREPFAGSPSHERWTYGNEELLLGTAAGAREVAPVPLRGTRKQAVTPVPQIPRQPRSRSRFTIAAHRALGLRPDYTDADLV